MHINTQGSRFPWSAVAVLSSLLSFGVNSAPQPNSWYLGAKASWLSASNACESHSIDCDNDTLGGGLFGGYVLNDWLAFEAGYHYLGEIEATYPALGFPAQTANYKGEMQGFEFVAKPYWQIDDNWSLFGKVGTLLWDMDVTGDEVNFTHEASDGDWSPLLGAGMEYSFNPNWSTTLEYQWVNDVGGSDTGGADLNIVSLGVIYHFVSDPAPVPVITPAPTLAPLPMVKEEASWSITGPSFAYDSSALTPELMQGLQPALERLKAHPQAHLNILTHTDSRGSEQYNQRLSDQRAQSVQTFLIEQGVQASQLTAKGMGESHPIADNRTEEGRYQNRRVELASPAFTIETTPAEGQQ